MNAQYATGRERLNVMNISKVVFVGFVALSALLSSCGSNETVKESNKPWVWYAPWFNDGSTPNAIQMDYYRAQLKAKGIEMVGVDIGESYGSEYGRSRFDTYYASLQREGYAKTGCMVLQSRGGLQGYTWAIDNQDKVSCVAGIYPLTTVEDYIGIPGMAPHWGKTEQWMRDNLDSFNPLNRAAEILFPVLHIHGNADSVVHIDPDREFISKVRDGSIIEVSGEGHAYYSDSFFKSDALVDFLVRNTK